MTKKHFIALGERFNQRKFIPSAIKRAIFHALGTPETQEEVERAAKMYDAMFDGLVRELADFCHDQNPRFDYHRWVEFCNGECGPNGGKAKAEVEVREV